ncbi:MAG: Eco57I restriction-modification methylase domain-containing protein [Anaerolineales bacterium]|nr:Eco57I restriction-modification methylase domain-containing protein [Anaerolineales bacterium]
MIFDLPRARKLLQKFDLPRLFIEEMGWNNPPADQVIEFQGQTLHLKAIAEKAGFAVFLCPPLADGRLPDYAGRRKIETLLRRLVHEHLIIFTNADRSQQKWQWVRHEIGRPVTSREFDYYQGQSGEALLERLQKAVFTLEEEESLTILDTTSRVRAAFDLERVTKHFYDRFKSEHAAFLKFLQGIPDENMQRWYASVMLNRLMFVYFIQKKGFLDNNPDYLRAGLEESQKRGADHYYRDFLCPLFFEGFAKKASERSPETNRLLGSVPYLDGGIFQRHQVEELYGQTIQVPDAAFQHLYDFFDQYRWHLDERPLRADNEINPDVLGYIFEKYINQKQMGAYYTKEDITEYISKSTILPYIFDQARRLHKGAFEGPGSIWELLLADPDRYIYEPVRRGADLPLPEEIAAGIEDVSQRGSWNRPAPSDYALPTEIWREVVARRQRYAEVRARLANGEIREINDFITCNLDIIQFAQDVIESLQDPDALRAFRDATDSIKVLDPTVGSGAFLFAALNILEPLYGAILERMQLFLDELEQSGQKHRPEKFKDFRGYLEEMGRHPNPRYFILKRIIILNLYGVDIMDEAVEICKLRLFLKLVAQVEQVEQIEPLPDIDFNIRVGNTLIGFKNREEVRKALTSTGKQEKLIIAEEESSILYQVEERVELANMAYQRFRKMQTEDGIDSLVLTIAKSELRKRLKDLNEELNHALAFQYLQIPISEIDYEKWVKNFHPFHWFVDFYEIINSGGFDVIIGNPPYVEYSQVRKEYTLHGYKTLATGNIYAFVIERSYSLLNNNGLSSMIVQLPIICTDRMIPLQKLCLESSKSIWFASFDDRPAKLFEGLEHIRATIFISQKCKNKHVNEVFSTTYNRWYSEQRPFLFEQLQFEKIHRNDFIGSIPKIGSHLSVLILYRLKSYNQLGFYLLKMVFRYIFITRHNIGLEL